MQAVINTNRTIIVNQNPAKSVLVNQAGKIVQVNIKELLGIDLTNLEDGSILIYSTNNEKFEASTLLEKQNINGGHF